jgi:hypothetical protein
MYKGLPVGTFRVFGIERHLIHIISKKYNYTNINFLIIQNPERTFFAGVRIEENNLKDSIFYHFIIDPRGIASEGV